MAFVDRCDDDNMGGNSLNLKLEIENDDDVEMETDDEDIRFIEKEVRKTLADETEEGELVDCKDEGLDEPVFDEHRPLARPNFPRSEFGKPLLRLLEENAFNTIEKRFENRSGGFVTGIDIFSAEEQEKLTKRAERFGIEPTEAKALSQKLLKNLYKSMGVTPGDPNIRLDALHMRGTEEMNTQDVFSYFKDYAPASIEWLTSSSCNIMWLDDISAARALLGLSVKIPNAHQKESKRRRKSVDRGSVEDATMDEDEESDKNSNDEGESDTVSLSDIMVPIPPGLWRMGIPHPRSKCIFLRFATSQDRRTPQADKLNSQDFSGYIGLISESKKRRFKEQLGGIMFYDTGDEVFEKSCPDDASNPWSAIAYSWGAFDRNKNKIRNVSPPKRPPPPSPVFINRYDRPDVWDVKNKRKYNNYGHSSDSEDWVKRRKVPRMRMHADDEAKLVEKRSEHSRIKRHKERRSDLRRRLVDREMIVIKKEKSDTSKDNSVEEGEEHEEEVPDLRVAVVPDRSLSPEDNKEDVWKSTGQVKSVLRGARAHDSHSHDGSDDDDRRVKSSVKKHRSRSRERHHRSRRRKESSRKHHSRSSSAILLKDRVNNHRHRLGGRGDYDEEYDSDEVIVQPDALDLRAKISKRKKLEQLHLKTKSRRERGADDGGGDYSHSGGSKNKSSSFRPKSPLQIEIDNDEYYKLIESD